MTLPSVSCCASFSLGDATAVIVPNVLLDGGTVLGEVCRTSPSCVVSWGRHHYTVVRQVSRFESVSGLSVYWPIIALGTRECGVAKLCWHSSIRVFPSCLASHNI